MSLNRIDLAPRSGNTPCNSTLLWRSPQAALPTFLYCCALSRFYHYFQEEGTQFVPAPTVRRHRGYRTLVCKGVAALYMVFNTQFGFRRVLSAMVAGEGAPCTLPFVLRYINAQPLFTSSLVTMVSPSFLLPCFLGDGGRFFLAGTVRCTS